MSQLIDSVEGLKSSGDSETNQVDNEFSSVSKDDIVEINTEKKTVEVTRTGDDYDRIFINGEEVAATPRGLLADGLKEMGFSISMKGPQGVGMGLTDTVLEWFAGMKVLKVGQYTFSLKFGEKVFNSKSFGYASELFGRYHPKYLPNGTKGKLNTGIIRIGWGNNNGVHTFRTSIFHSPNQIHIDWFWKPKTEI